MNDLEHQIAAAERALIEREQRVQRLAVEARQVGALRAKQLGALAVGLAIARAVFGRRAAPVARDAGAKRPRRWSGLLTLALALVTAATGAPRGRAARGSAVGIWLPLLTQLFTVRKRDR